MQQIIGHKKQLAFLERIATGHGAQHAFLFYGPAHIGKAAVARAFARRITEGGEHLAEQDIAAPLQFPGDVVTVTREDGERTIGIDAVRAAQEAFALSCAGAGKVLIIDDADALTVAAQNALLKVLEEPLEQRWIILIAQAPGALIATVRSRVGHVAFAPAEREDIAAHFADAPEEQKAVAAGRVGLVQRFANDAEYFESYQQAQAQLQALRSATAAEKIALAQELAGDTQQCILFLEEGARSIYQAAHRASAHHVLIIAERFAQALRTLQTSNANKRLVLEELFLAL